MHIRFITTGGTIDKIYFDALSQYEVGESPLQSILAEGMVQFDFDIVALTRKDSLEITDEDRARLREYIANDEGDLYGHDARDRRGFAGTAWKNNCSYRCAESSAVSHDGRRVQYRYGRRRGTSCTTRRLYRDERTGLSGGIGPQKSRQKLLRKDLTLACVRDRN